MSMASVLGDGLMNVTVWSKSFDRCVSCPFFHLDNPDLSCPKIFFDCKCPSIQLMRPAEIKRAWDMIYFAKLLSRRLQMAYLKERNIRLLVVLTIILIRT